MMPNLVTGCATCVIAKAVAHIEAIHTHFRLLDFLFIFNRRKLLLKIIFILLLRFGIKEIVV